MPSSVVPLCMYVYYSYSTKYSVLAAQQSYLPWLDHTGVNAGEVEACDDCSSEEISLPVNVPFGNYYHTSVYVSGIIIWRLEMMFSNIL